MWDLWNLHKCNRRGWKWVAKNNLMLSLISSRPEKNIYTFTIYIMLYSIFWILWVVFTSSLQWVNAASIQNRWWPSFLSFQICERGFYWNSTPEVAWGCLCRAWWRRVVGSYLVSCPTSQGNIFRGIFWELAGSYRLPGLRANISFGEQSQRLTRSQGVVDPAGRSNKEEACVCPLQQPAGTR